MALQPTKYIWLSGKWIPWDECKVHVLTHALHYGSGVFEGIRFYKTNRGPAIFRLREHIERLFYSASCLAIEIPYSIEELCAVARELVARNEIDEGYIRPLAFYGYGVMGLKPMGAPTEVAFACWPWGAYLPHDMVDIKTSSYRRISPKSMKADAKINGNYVNSILAVLELRGTKYHEAIFLDDNGFIAEGPGENFFMVKDDQIFTPKLGAILAGITRDTVINLARAAEIVVHEKNIQPDEVLLADEAFFTGTAAEVTPIRSLDDKVIGSGRTGPKTAALKKAYLELVRGEGALVAKYLTFVN